jgi:hypothetical protein
MKIGWRKYLFAGWATLTTVGLAALMVDRAESNPKTVTFDTLNVQRLNVMEPDGKPRVVIANRSHFPGLYWDGKEYRHHSRDSAGFLFFNDDGDEVGGMTFDSRKLPGGGHSASSGLMFDQYKNDQTVGLTYDEENGRRRAGLRVWDRGNADMTPAVVLSDRIARAKTPQEKAALEAELRKLVTSGDYGGGERVFAGKELGDSLIRLADRQGRPRLVLKVDGKGEPSVQFLSEDGKVLKTITAD